MAPSPAASQQDVHSAHRESADGSPTPDGGTPASSTAIDELRSVCRGLLNALDDERRAASAANLKLGVGARVAVIGSGSRYRFAVSTLVDASVGAPSVLRLGHREVEGIVESYGDGVIELSLSEDVGADVAPGAELLLDAPWMIARLRQRVREAFEVGHGTPALFNLTNALRTLGIGEIEVAAVGLTPEYENRRRPLNEMQARAITVALRSPLSVIAAPAGTGKTLTLGALVEACYRAGLRTLVAAPSNVAVDLTMQQVCDRLATEPGFRAAEVLRVGADVGGELRSAFGAEIVLEDVTARLRPKLHARVARLQAAVDTLAEELTAAHRASIGEADEHLQALRRRLAAARSDLREVRREARDYGRALSMNARVVGATLARVFLDTNLRGFDVVVIDEASMAQAPAVLVAAGQARRHVVVAGDPCQLAAPVHATGPHRHWLATDVFERLDVLSAIRHEEEVPYLTQLTEQRRSAEGICGLQRALWYGPTLRTAREVFAREQARHNVIFGTSALCYLDTSSLAPRAYHPWGRTFANDEHARVAADLIAYLDSAGEIPGPGNCGPEVLVLSHYRGQVSNVRRVLGSRYQDRGVAVRTVHRAQGCEATTCILDLTLTRHQPTRQSSVLTAVRLEEEGSRLLAVAASRARSRLIVLSDFEWIEAAISPTSVLGRMYAHLREHGHAIPLAEVSTSPPPPHLRVVR